jgi:hypothetical protein
MEKEEKVCRDDDKHLGLMVKRARAADSTAKLIAVKKEVVKFEQDINRRAAAPVGQTGNRKHRGQAGAGRACWASLLQGRRRRRARRPDRDAVSCSDQDFVPTTPARSTRPLTRLADRQCRRLKPEQPESRPAVASRPHRA